MIKEAVTDIDPTCRATLGLNLEASKPYGIKLCAGLSFGEKLEKIKSLMSVSCKDLAKILRINEATLRRWRKDESLPLVGNGERGRDTYLKKFKEGLRKRDKGKPKEWPGSLARWLFDAANEPQAPTKKTLENEQAAKPTDLQEPSIGDGSILDERFLWEGNETVHVVSPKSELTFSVQTSHCEECLELDWLPDRLYVIPASRLRHISDHWAAETDVWSNFYFFRRVTPISSLVLLSELEGEAFKALNSVREQKELTLLERLAARAEIAALRAYRLANPITEPIALPHDEPDWLSGGIHKVFRPGTDDSEKLKSFDQRKGSKFAK